MSTIIRAESVTKTFGDTIALDDVSVAVESGQCVGMLGPNGAGKTTFLTLVEGLRAPTRGSVELFGGDPKTPPHGCGSDPPRRRPHYPNRCGFRRCCAMSRRTIPRRRRPSRSSTSSNSLRSSASSAAPCPEVNSGASRLPWRSSATRSSCSSTNRRPGWTSMRAASCGRRAGTPRLGMRDRRHESPPRGDRSARRTRHRHRPGDGTSGR